MNFLEPLFRWLEHLLKENPALGFLGVVSVGGFIIALAIMVYCRMKSPRTRPPRIQVSKLVAPPPLPPIVQEGAKESPVQKDDGDSFPA
jgi:hypothetical protein